MTRHARRTATAAAAIRPALVFPESDGKPLGETDWHVEQILYLRAALKQRFAGEPDVRVGADMFVYRDPEDTERVVCPDVFLVRGVPDAKALRRTYKTWLEGKGLDLVVEVASRSTLR